MKKQMMTMFAAVVMAAGFSNQTAKAEQNLMAKVPFEFRVGETMIQPGTYQIVAGDGKMLVTDARGRRVAISLVTRGRSKGGSKLVFHVVGDHYFLDSIHYDGDLTQLRASKQEESLRRTGEMTRVASIPLGRAVSAD